MNIIYLQYLLRVLPSNLLFQVYLMGNQNQKKANYEF